MSSDDKLKLEKKLKKSSKEHKPKKDKKEKKEKKEKKDKKSKKLDKVEEEMSTESEKSAITKHHEFEEIEIKLDEDTPLSKKEQRLLKKGKITLEQLKEKKAISVEPSKEESKAETTDDADSKKPEPKSKFSVWIGNLSFDTTSEDIIAFITSKTSDYAELSNDLSDGQLVQIKDSDITRVNLPRKLNKNKGFAHVDFKTPAHVKTAISLSESDLNGRNLLIKDSTSFEGRPEKALSKNPPSRILFVGNLSFDTTKELLEEHFRHCGEIIKIRMATFEDSGKCKGFAFIDFRNDEGPTAALKDKLCKRLIGRPLRLEFGEDRSNRKVFTKRPAEDANRDEHREEEPKRARFDNDNHSSENGQGRERASGFQAKQDKSQGNFKKFDKFNTNRDNIYASNNRVKSSIALSSAQRASAAIVKSTGKKVKFD